MGKEISLPARTWRNHNIGHVQVTIFVTCLNFAGTGSRISLPAVSSGRRVKPSRKIALNSNGEVNCRELARRPCNNHAKSGGIITPLHTWPSKWLLPGVKMRETWFPLLNSLTAPSIVNYITYLCAQKNNIVMPSWEKSALALWVSIYFEVDKETEKKGPYRPYLAHGLSFEKACIVDSLMTYREIKLKWRIALWALWDNWSILSPFLNTWVLLSRQPFHHQFAMQDFKFLGEFLGNPVL